MGALRNGGKRGQTSLPVGLVLAMTSLSFSPAPRSSHGCLRLLAATGLVVSLLAFSGCVNATPKAPPPAAAWDQATIQARMAKRDYEGLKREVITPTIAEFEAIAARENRRIFCASSPVEVLKYMTDAVDAKTEAIALDGKYSAAFFIRGYIAVEEKNYSLALRDVGRAVELSPSNPHYLSELGYLVSLSRDYEKAIRFYERAIEGAELLHSDDKDADEKRRAMRGKGFCLIELGRFEEAVKLYAECLKLYPNDAAAKNELGYIRSLQAKTGVFQGR